MAEPGDLPPTDDPLDDLGDDHDDDLIGFATPASLQGRSRVAESEPESRPEPVPEPEPEPEAEPVAAREPGPGPRPVLDRAPQPDLPELEIAAPALALAPALEPALAPVEAGSVFAPSRSFSARTRRRDEGPALPGGGLGLYTVYALILFAVPTVGVSAALGLLAVTGRKMPQDDLSASHFIYQRRTLWAAAVTTVTGVVLLAAPFALGVPILFGLALWLVARGASGVWALKAGRPIANPRGWWI